MATFIGSTTFNGTSQHVSYSSGSAGPHKDITYPFTMVYWMQHDGFSGSDYDFCMSSTAGNVTLVAFRTSSTAALTGIVRANGGSNYIMTGGTGSTGTWYHMAMVVRSATDRELYQDGASVATDSNSADVVAYTGAMSISSVGKLETSAGTNYMQGRVAHCRIYNTELSLSQIKALQYNPWAVADDILWAPDMQVSPSAASDHIDRAGNYTPNAATLGTVSALCPPIHLFGGG